MFNLSERVKEIALDLTSVLSVVGTKGEVDMAEKVYSIMEKIPYFKENKDKLYFLDCEGDHLGRKVVVAEVNGKKTDSKDTVVMIGHFDTVGVSDYGDFKDYATKPLELPDKLKTLKLSEDVRKDLESGEYLFGRGLYDMKSGVASIIAIIEHITKDIDNFKGNIVFGAVCDEEGNSTGMLNLVPYLNKLKEKKGYNYLAMLDPDYSAPQYPGDPTKYVYIGSVGKIMPSFYIVGKETHVGEPFSGIDPNQISSEILGRINLNPEFSDEAEGEYTLPPLSLKQRDLKPEYSVQTANKSILFFNYATHKKEPNEIMKDMVGVAEECFEKVVNVTDERYKKYAQMSNKEYKKLPWKARAMSFGDFSNLVKKEVGEKFDSLVKDFSEKISKDNNFDMQEKAMKIVEYVHGLWSDKDPIIIVFYSPPYYPHCYVGEELERDKRLNNAVKKSVKAVEEKFNVEIVEKKFLPCISDLSYATAPTDKEAIAGLLDNVPGYGDIYSLPLEEMQKLNLPVADIGTYGKDAHQFTERINTFATFNLTPELLHGTLIDLLTNTHG